VIEELNSLREDVGTMLNKVSQLDAKFASSRGEALPSDFPVPLPVKTVEMLDVLNEYLADHGNRKILVTIITFCNIKPT
jgi:hypothetical protein